MKTGSQFPLDLPEKADLAFHFSSLIDLVVIFSINKCPVLIMKNPDIKLSEASNPHA